MRLAREGGCCTDACCESVASLASPLLVREGAGEDRERDEVGQSQAHAAHGAAREQHARPGEPASPVPNGQQTPEQCREQEPESRVEERVDVDNPRWAAQSNHVGKGRCENPSGAIGRTPQGARQLRRCQRRVVGDSCVGQAVVATFFVDIHRQRLERIDLSILVGGVELDERRESKYRVPELTEHPEEKDNGRDTGGAD